MLYKKIRIELYQQTLHLVISEDVESEIKEIQKSFFIQLERFDFMGYSERVGNNHILLLNRKYIRNERDLLSTLFHEIFHISSFICKRVGIVADYSNDEAQAYLISFLADRALKYV